VNIINSIISNSLSSASKNKLIIQNCGFYSNMFPGDSMQTKH